MASSQQLKAGNGGPAAAIRSTWLAHNVAIGKSVKILQNQARSGQCRFLSVCYSAPAKGWRHSPHSCRAHVNYVGKTEHDCDIVSCQLEHACGAEDTKRKRNYKTSEIAAVSEAVALHKPTANGEGNARQLVDITKASTGLDMRPGQAHRAVHCRADDTLVAQIGQCMLLPSLFEFFKGEDVSGSYDLETVPCDWDVSLRQFQRCYVCLSCMKHFWKRAVIKFLVVDGTHTKCPGFKHVVLLAVTFDGDNNIVPLSFGIVDVENADNWVWFQEHSQEDFPGFEIAMSDADKGITSDAFSLSQTEADALTSRCARHMSENCRENFKCSVNEGHKLLVLSLAKARTEETHHMRLADIRNVHKEWADWLDARKHEFVACTFLQRGVQRWGKATSNAGENINSALLDARNLSVMLLILAIVDKMQAIHRKGKKKARRFTQEGKQLCPCAIGEQSKILGSAIKRKVIPLVDDHPHCSGKVATGIHSNPQGLIEVQLEADEHNSKCPCQCHQEFGMQCEHTLSLIHHCGLEPGDTWWFDQRYHVSTCAASCDCDLPGLAPGGRLVPDMFMAPPECKRPAGRPSEKRKERSHMKKTTKQHQCAACGGLGHTHRTCEAPSTKFRFQQHHEAACQWATTNGCTALEKS